MREKEEEVQKGQEVKVLPSFCHRAGQGWGVSQEMPADAPQAVGLSTPRVPHLLRAADNNKMQVFSFLFFLSLLALFFLNQACML